MPHVRQEERKIGKTKVSVRAEWDTHGITQLNDFLRITAYFNKRFYTKTDSRTEQPCPEEDELWYTVFYAIAISRDLIYEFHWTVPCSRDLSLNKTWAEYLRCEVPLYGLIPSDPDVKACIYPHNKTSLWQDVFRYEGFVEVNHIEEEE